MEKHDPRRPLIFPVSPYTSKKNQSFNGIVKQKKTTKILMQKINFKSFNSVKCRQVEYYLGL